LFDKLSFCDLSTHCKTHSQTNTTSFVWLWFTSTSHPLGSLLL
jgi:hypothetical protein